MFDIYEWYPNLPVFDDKLDEAPEDLRSLVEMGYSIQRLKHPSYPDGVFFDNVAVHTFRLVNKANSLPIEDEEKQKIIRMLWIHDLPEAYLETENDVTAIEKENNPHLAGIVAHNELAAAERILSPEDYKLYWEFKDSSDALKSGVVDGSITAEGVIAKILDTSDGNMAFHYFLTRWMAGDTYDSSKLPIEAALTYTFRFTEMAKKNLYKLNLTEEDLEIALGLLDEQINYVINLWERIPEERLPTSIQTHLDTIKHTD